MKDWVECQGCWAEFKVISDSDEPVAFCPYCGDELVLEDEEDEDDDFEEE